MRRLIGVAAGLLAVLAFAGTASASLLPCVHVEGDLACVAQVGPHTSVSTTVTYGSGNATIEAYRNGHDINAAHTHTFGPNRVVYASHGVRIVATQIGKRRYRLSARAKHRCVIAVVLGPGPAATFTTSGPVLMFHHGAEPPSKPSVWEVLRCKVGVETTIDGWPSGPNGDCTADETFNVIRP